MTRSPLPRSRGSRDQARLAVVVVILVLSVMLAITVWIGSLANRGVANVVDGALESATDSAVARISEYVSESEDTTDGLARWIAQDDPDPEEVADRLLVTAVVDEELRAVAVAYADDSWVAAEHVGGGEDVAYVVVVSEGAESGGTQTVTTYSSSLALTDTWEEAAVLTAPELGFWDAAAPSYDLVWTDPALRPFSQAASAWAALAVRDGQETVAVVGTEFPLDAVAKAVNTVALGDSGEVYLLDADRQVLAAPAPLQPRVQDAFVADEPPASPALTIETTAQATPYDAAVQLGVDGDMRTAEVGLNSVGLPWIVHLRALEDEVSPEVIDLRQALGWAAAIMFGVVLGAAALLFVLWRPFSAMRSAAFTDSLTGLLRRGRFLDLAPGAIADAHHAGGVAYIVVLDLDRFKALNDSLGHDAGDRALSVVGHALESAVRRRDLVSRWGGDEFVVLLNVPDIDVGEIAMERLRTNVSGALGSAFPDQVGLGVTAGGAVSRGPRDRVEVLVSEADAALVEGKQQAKSRSYPA